MSKVTFKRTIQHEESVRFSDQIQDILEALTKIKEDMTTATGNTVKSLKVLVVDSNIEFEIQQIANKDFADLGAAYDNLKKKYGKDLLRVDFEQA